ENKINKMSTRFMMALIMKLLSILFSAALIRSNQSMVPLKSFKINDNVTYDCIDIYKQPGIDHPLLRNHTIQMQPSVSRHEIKKQIGNNKTFKKMKCPYGTVPVLRNTKEFISSAQLFVNNSHLISADSPGTHINPALFGDGRVWTYGFWKEEKDVIIRHVKDLFNSRIMFQYLNPFTLIQGNWNGCFALSIRINRQETGGYQKLRLVRMLATVLKSYLIN
ncbi:unnamed protein product, partial [Thlaspi arvense]